MSRRALLAAFSGSRNGAFCLAFGLALLAPWAARADQPCPAGKSCYYVPPVIPPPTVSPDGYGGDVLVASPQNAATGTYSINGGTAQSLSISAGGSTRIAFDSTMVAAGYHQAMNQGLFLQSSEPTLIPDERMTAVYWQSSATVKPSTVALGTRFRAGGYSLNSASGGDGTGWDYIMVYAPTDANITAAAPPGAATPFWNDGVSTATTTFSLTGGQTYILRTRSGVDIDGALITSDVPVSVAVGGRGWIPSACGDDGEDLLVPTDKFGSIFVVPSWPSTTANRVRVVADTDSTTVQYTTDGFSISSTTINAGQYVEFVPAANTVTLVTSSNPTIVFQNAGITLCELDLAVVPPAVFANIPSQTLTFNVLTGDTGVAKAVVPTAQLASLRYDGAAITSPSTAAVPGHPEWTVVAISVAAGTHTLFATSDFQLGLVAGTGGTGLYGYPSPYRIAGCGDSVIGSGEGCDDGNVSDGDGCSSVCQIETGFNCSGTPSTCGCTMDATCSNHTAGTYCASGTSGGPNVCATTGGLGTPIPADHGTCGGSSGLLGTPEDFCASGACNPSNDTCAAPNGNTCTGDSACASNTCLTVTMTCGAAGGCTVDGDCASDHYCASNSLCQPRRANSTACTGNGQCTSGVCDVDNVCGYADAHGTCTDTNAATVCRSQTCGSSSRQCVAPTNGCVLDADCTNTYCGTSVPAGVSFQCTAKIVNGQSIPSDTLHHATCTTTSGSATCQSGVCDSDNSCGFKLGDGPCTADAQCRSGAAACVASGANAGKCEVCSATTSIACTGAAPVCNTATNACAPCAGDYGTTGMACTSSADPFCKGDGSCGTCASNADCVGATHAGPICNLVNGTCGDVCAGNGDCATTEYCDASHTCQMKKIGNATCAAAVECAAGICAADGMCGFPLGLGTCASDSQCRPGTICIADGANSGKCEPCSLADANSCTGMTPVCGNTNSCVGCTVDHGVTGAACPSTAAPYCRQDGACGTCASNADCAASNHGGTVCSQTTGTCVAACATSTDCAAGQFCTVTHACQTRKDSGATCDTGVECTSSVCDTDSLCGYGVDRGPCANDSQCRAGTICVSDGTTPGKCEACAPTRATACTGATPLCGAADRCTGCTVDYGARGAACPSSTPLCLGDGSCASCRTNADCTGSNHDGSICDVTTGSCGTACATGNDCANTQYCGASHTCQPVKETGASCAAGSECGNGVCAADGQCGYAIGGGPCAGDTQCRPGALCVTEGANAGKCEACTSTNAATCTNGTPLCGAANSCVGCGADYGAAGAACPTAANPMCKSDGACGRCSSNADCVGGHVGMICSPTTGSCGTQCTTDDDCGSGKWCDSTAEGNMGACQARVTDGQPLPAGACSTANAGRLCASGVCDIATNKCGTSTPTTGAGGRGGSGTGMGGAGMGGAGMGGAGMGGVGGGIAGTPGPGAIPGASLSGGGCSCSYGAEPGGTGGLLSLWSFSMLLGLVVRRRRSGRR